MHSDLLWLYSITAICSHATFYLTFLLLCYTSEESDLMRAVGYSTARSLRRHRRAMVPLADMQLANSSGRIVLNALLGSTTMPRGNAVWSQHHVLGSQAVRSDADHLLHNTNSPVRDVLIDALHERQPFCTSERRLLSQRSNLLSSSTRITTGAHHEAVIHSPTVDIAGAPVVQWFSIGIHELSRRGVPLAKRWEDFLFPLLQHYVFKSPDLKQLSVALELITSLVQWQVDRLLEQEAEGIAEEVGSTLMMVSPRWARKLRKLLCEQGSKGSIMIFAQWFTGVRDAESRCGRCTMLTGDVELLQFLVTIPCRKDSGLPRQHIATETARLMEYACTSLWGLHTDRGHDSSDTERNPMEALTRCLTQGSNAIAFAQNDGKEPERLRSIFVASAMQTLSFGSDIVAAELANTVLNTAVLSIRRKCAALQFTTARSYATVLCEMMTAQAWIGGQVHLRRAPNVVLSDVLSMLDGVASQVSLLTTPSSLLSIVTQLESFLGEMGTSLRVPDVFDRLVSDVFSVVDPLLDPVGLSCGRIRALVVAAGSNAPQGSSWGNRSSRMPFEETWQCGCGDHVALSTRSCPRCTIHSKCDAVLEGQFQCAQCHATNPATGNCTSCSSDHPLIHAALASGTWNCQACATVMTVTTPACPSCATTNPLQAAVCASCCHRNAEHVQACSLCGTPLHHAVAPIRLQLCGSCAAPSELPHGASRITGCTKCKGPPVAEVPPAAAVETRHFRWQCGCGSWNSPLDRRCHSCCPLSTRRAGALVATLYKCPSCNTACTHSGVQMVEMEAVPHLPNGPITKVACCGSCGSWHPRDVALLVAPRLTSCPSCDSVLSIEDSSQQCPQCQLHLDERTTRAAAFVDLPWVCHCCSAYHVITNEPEGAITESISYCSHCHAERPSPLLFSPNAPWACASCSSTSRGFSCTTCGLANPHLPRSEVMLWRCDAADCAAWNHSWDASCSCCTSTRAPSSARAAAADWSCQRCKLTNGPLMSVCWSCEAAAPTTRQTPVDAEDSMRHTRSILLRAAEEGSRSPLIPLSIAGIETAVGADLRLPGLSDGELADVDDILGRFHFMSP
jgi:hypothetical protein